MPEKLEHVDANASAARTPVRRSSRVRLQVRMLICLSPGSPAEECRTIEVGAFGACIDFSRALEIGQLLVLTKPNSQDELRCIVRNLRKTASDTYNIGIEFASESSKFWGMTFPSSDWDPSERKVPQRPAVSNNPASHAASDKLPDHGAGTDEAAAERPASPWASFRLIAIGLGSVLSLALIYILITRDPTTTTGVADAPVYRNIAPEEAQLIPGIEKYRSATLGDFDPDAVSWLKSTGQNVTGQVTGSFSAFGQSRVYLLIGNDNKMWRVVILANGHLRCDAQYRSVAIVARVPKASVANVGWADPPPSETEGDGLLVVRSADDFRTAVVLFLKGDQVVSGTPSDYRQIPLNTQE